MAEANDAAPAAEAFTVPANSTLDLDALELQQKQQQTNRSRRLRPPDLSAPSPDEQFRIPLRGATGSQKLSRKESRLGLRSLFSRNKPVVGAENQAAANCASPTASTFGAGKSLWPRPFYAAHSETTSSENAETPPGGRPAPTLATHSLQVPRQLFIRQGPASPASPASLASPASPAASRKKKPVKLASTVRSTALPSPRSGRGSLATWDPPPLFQAYPQAIKQAQLPACKISVDALIRFQGSYSNANGPHVPTSGESAEDNTSTDGMVSKAAADKVSDEHTAKNVTDKACAEKDRAVGDKAKRKHRRDASGLSLRLDWQDKIYVLVTSGYLLQYAGEGSFDRLPEKILHITKDSAAFASDLIPGRHWVLQVCSALDADGTAPTSDTRSLFSRLPFRGYERRQATTFLLVFDNADEMEGWITILRREIEQFGGKKHLSETGTPKTNSTLARQITQSSQRTLVVRDPDRFSRLVSPHDVNLFPPRSEIGSVDVRDRTSDDMSATNSICSHDGRQLERLRDSDNRFSYISSGQRTMVTSDSSSPPSSPLHDSFTSNPGDESLSLSEGNKDVSRPRTNAAAMVARRQSTQQPPAMQRTADSHPPQPISPPAAATEETTAQPAEVPASIFPLAATQAEGSPPPILVDQEANPPPPGNITGHIPASFPLPPSPPTIPNFSVPHLANKRFSIAGPRSPVSEPTLVIPSLHLSPSLPPTQSTFEEASVARHSARRLPPPSLVFSRPPPIVEDRPSPRSASKLSHLEAAAASFENAIPRSPDSDSSVPNTAALFSPWTMAEARSPSDQSRVSRTVPGQSEPLNTAAASPPLMGPARIQTAIHTSPRRHSSMMALRTSEATAEHERGACRLRFSDTEHVCIQQAIPSTLPASSTATGSVAQLRRTSMLVQPSSIAVSRPASVYRHGAMSGRGAQDGSKGGSLDTGRGRMATSLGPPKPLPVPPTAPMAQMGQRMRSRSTSSRLGGLARRSMYQLADGPPPAPPPTCALPPLPAKVEDLGNQRRSLQI